MNNIVIKFANSFVDVFSGAEGWEEHTRFQVTKYNNKKRLHFISGKTLNTQEFQFVKSQLV